MCPATRTLSLSGDRGRVRVLHVAPDAPGGMTAAVRGLLSSPLGDAYEMELLVSARYDDHGPKRRLRTFAAAVAKLAAWSLGRGPRIVHVHMGPRGSCYRKGICVIVAKTLRRPVVLHAHSGRESMAEFWNRIGPVRRWLLRRALVAADELLSVSEAGARELETWGRRKPATIVPNTVPWPGIADPARRHGGPVRILYLGGFLRAEKGFGVLAAALERLLESNPDVSVALAGPGRPPAEMRPLLARPEVAWLGWLAPAAKDAELRRADIFVLPSQSEGLPLAMLEAMANGLAIVATRVGGVPEVLTDRVDALLVDSDEPGPLAAALRTLVESPAERRRLASAAVAEARRLRGDVVEQRLRAVYDSLTSDQLVVETPSGNHHLSPSRVSSR